MPGSAEADASRAAVLWLLAPLAYLLLFAAIYSDVVAGQASFIRRDIARFYFPMWRFAAERLAEGVFPLWNPLNNFGCPFFANVQTCVSYPPAVLMRVLDFSYGFGLFVVFHLFLSACATYAWMRDVGCSREGAFLSGAAFSLGGWCFSTLNLTISLASAAYFPLALLCLRRALSGARPWQAALSAALLLQFLAGDPAVLLGTLMVCLLFCLWRAAELSAAAGRVDLSPVGRLLPSLALFFGAAAYQMIPFLELVLASIRSSLRPEEALMWSMQINDLIGIAIPFFSDLSMYVMDYWTRQSWLENYYAAVTVLTLGAAAWTMRRQGPLTSYLVLLAILGIALSMGRNSAVYPALRTVFPPLGLVRYPVRFYFLFAFAAACLAGLGLDALLRARSGGRKRVPVFLAAAAAVTAVTAIVWTTAFSVIEARVSEWAYREFAEAVKPFYSVEELRSFVCAALSNARRSVFFLSVCLLGIAGCLASAPRRAVLSAFFILLVTADLATANLIEPRVPPGVLERPTGNVSRILEEEGLFRVLASPKTVHHQTFTTLQAAEATQEDQKEQLTSNFLMLYGIHDALGYDSIYLKDTSRIQNELMKLKDPAASTLLDWLNIRYVASPKDELPGFDLVRRSKAANLYRNPRALPRVLLSSEARTQPDRELLIAELLKPDYDARKVLWLEEAVEAGPPAPAAGPGQVLAVDHGSDRVLIDVRVDGEAWLFISDTFAPGWRARSDGVPLKVYRANYAFRAVRLGPGEHRVVWEYRPDAFTAGCWITACTLAAAAAWLTAPRGPLSFASPEFRMRS